MNVRNETLEIEPGGSAKVGATVIKRNLDRSLSVTGLTGSRHGESTTSVPENHVFATNRFEKDSQGNLVQVDVTIT